ncbi:hypothetical protein ACQ4PT_036429 [Festuca glaucescens]
MGSNEPLGTPAVDDPDTHDSDTVVVEDDYLPSSLGVGASAAPRHGAAADADKKRKRSVFAEEDVGHMTFITKAVEAVAQAITNVAPPNVHPALYSAVMDASSKFSAEAKMKFNWYVVYGRVPGVYSSWKEVGPLVNGYENNLHKGYKTREEAEEAYSKFLSQQAGFYVHPLVEVHEAPPKNARHGEGSSLKNLIIVVLVIWIMYLMRS